MWCVQGILICQLLVLFIQMMQPTDAAYSSSSSSGSDLSHSDAEISSDSSASAGGALPGLSGSITEEKSPPTYIEGFTFRGNPNGLQGNDPVDALRNLVGQGRGRGQGRGGPIQRQPSRVARFRGQPIQPQGAPNNNNNNYNNDDPFTRLDLGPPGAWRHTASLEIRDPDEVNSPDPQNRRGGGNPPMAKRFKGPNGASSFRRG